MILLRNVQNLFGMTPLECLLRVLIIVVNAVYHQIYMDVNKNSTFVKVKVCCKCMSIWFFDYVVNFNFALMKTSSVSWIFLFAKAKAKMHDRLAQLKIRHMDTPAQRQCSNMLVASMHSFVLLQSDYNQEELAHSDGSIANLIMRDNGI